MATRFELVLAGDDEARLRAVGEAAFQEIEECEERLSRFRPQSLVSRINAAAHDGWVELDPDTWELLLICAEVHRDSGGAFDPTVAPLLRALGFDSGGGGPSGHDDVAAAARSVGMAHVAFDHARHAVRFTRGGMALDLGAIGKGHALDLAAAVLRGHGVERALLHGGTSTVVAIGAPPGETGWRVALGRPASAPTALLCDAALSVSAQHGRVVEREGRELGHVIDPRTGRPATRHAAAAVLGRAARATDAWSTALLAGGPELRLPPDLSAMTAARAADGSLVWSGRGRRADSPSRFIQRDSLAPRSTTT